MAASVDVWRFVGISGDECMKAYTFMPARMHACMHACMKAFIHHSRGVLADGILVAHCSRGVLFS